MKVVSVFGGLGSQMFKYAFYLAIKEKCNDECLIDTSHHIGVNYPFLIDRLFGKKDDDIVQRLTDKQKEDIKHNKKSYIDCCLEYLTSIGQTTYYVLGTKHIYNKAPIPILRIIQQKILYALHFAGIRFRFDIDDVLNPKIVYYNEYFHVSDEHFTFCKDIILEAFSFPEFSDEKNITIAQEMQNENSVAFHVRRTDYSRVNKKLMKRQFYQKAVGLIKEYEPNSTFYVFSDDMNWCRSNLEELGLSKKDKVLFIDWNSGKNSFRDMQLMTYCKHNIISNSAFSWWGYYLSKRTNKIVCAPIGFWEDVKNHF